MQSMRNETDKKKPQAIKATDLSEGRVTAGAEKITGEWKIENMEISGGFKVEVEQVKMSRSSLWWGGKSVSTLTHWPSDAAKITVYRLESCGWWEGKEEGIKGSSREAKTGRLTEW